jgi:hypothetical protein
MSAVTEGVIRDCTSADYAALARIHAAQGIDYALPDLDFPLFFVKKVLTVDGDVRAAMVLKLCAETFLLLDGFSETHGKGRPQEKMAAMQMLQRSVLNEAYARGLDEIHASVPAIGFDKRLVQLGWLRDRLGWNLWSRSTQQRI